MAFQETKETSITIPMLKDKYCPLGIVGSQESKDDCRDIYNNTRFEGLVWPIRYSNTQRAIITSKESKGDYRDIYNNTRIDRFV
jgi:hypothetical protein